MLLYSIALLLAPLAGAACYEPSSAHPPPEYDADDAQLKLAFESITHDLDALAAPHKHNSTSFSVEITSAKESLWSYHHTARSRNESRPDIPTVNGDALYRIASITKAFTVLGLLYQHAAGNLSLDDTIDRYVEELRGNDTGSIQWRHITLRTLASQLSGIPREFAQADIINLIPKPWELGLPPLSRDGLPECDEYGHDFEPPCAKHDLIDTIISKAPTFAPNQKSTYSNVAFELLGLAIENVTGQAYNTYINEAIFKPLGMSKSTLSTPPDSAGVIPVEPHYWDVDEGIQAPTGGIYSSSSDLSAFLRYVLTHHNNITPALNWAHPHSPAEGLHSFYGMPWEILQTDKILLDSQRPVRFITKGGGLPGYQSIIIFMPEYDLGITLLVAGPGLAIMDKMLERVLVQVVRAAEQLSIRQLEARYAGTYAAARGHVNSSITLVADTRGLVVTQLVSNSTNLLSPPVLGLLNVPEDRAGYLQLVPTGMYSDEEEREGERWRMVTVEGRDEGARGILDDFCITDVEEYSYAGIPINEVALWEGEGGKNGGVVDVVELTAFRVKLERLGTEDELDRDDAQEQLEL
ncbi:beta-lactamase family protein [Polyplosphaeria fusca]|uniref:Beta-lactamase family protein n=1 Tax=Polyplosphaeria fusca TaxID=682080 RepID=A0A9P4QR63_9PLEO|nr:beta-lactamase family protein [Polyplosphaeria fusca]